MFSGLPTFFECRANGVTPGGYIWEIGNWGDLGFDYRSTFLDTFDAQPIPGGTIDECAGTWGGNCGRPRPEYKHTFTTTWNTPWNWAFNLGWRNVGEVSEFGQDRYTASAQNYIDLSGSYVADWFNTTTTFNFGIVNAGDREPPFNGLINNASFSNGNTFPGTWDTLGRYWFVGLNVAM